MRIDILTLFPSMFDGPMTESMLWKARDRKLLDLHLHQIRNYALDRHHVVDDTPYGGGGGMLLRADVLVRAVEAVQAQAEPAPVILMSPGGRVFSHKVAVELAGLNRFIILCGHYEGLDERARQLVVTDEISIGDYVLTGGELPAMVIVDAVVRHIPGVLGAEGGADRESHADGILEGAHYTHPVEFRGLTVPTVLQDGNHAAIERWRREDGLRRTWRYRPDLLLKAQLSEAERYLLANFAEEDARKIAEANRFHPTPYPEVNAALAIFLAEVKAILKERFLGLYLYGSLATGDFEPDRSDIDFVGLTDGELPAETIQALEGMHARLYASGSKWLAKLEGAYVPQAMIRRYHPDDPEIPYLNEGHFYMAQQESDWIIQRYVLREQGVVVAGSGLRDWIDPVPVSEIRRSVLEFLHGWWEPMLDHPVRLESDEYQAYAVLTMCRALDTLETGVIASKLVSARRMQAALGETWSPLIERALAWRPGSEMNRFEQTQALIRYTLERSHQWDTPVGDA